MLRSAIACGGSEGADAGCCAKGTPCAVGIWHTVRFGKRSIWPMRAFTLLAVAILLAASPKAIANDAKPLQLKVPKAALTTSTPAATAPFAIPMGEPEPMLMPPPDARQAQSRSSCENATTLCYDATERRIVYKPARNLMPDLPGLTRENISVKRDRIVFRYSF